MAANIVSEETSGIHQKAEGEQSCRAAQRTAASAAWRAAGQVERHKQLRRNRHCKFLRRAARRAAESAASRK